MDRLTQMQMGIDNLLLIIYSTINFIATNSNFKQLNEDMQPPQPVNRDDMASNLAEMTSDLIGQANQLKLLLNHLPDDSNTQPTPPTPINSPVTQLKQEIDGYLQILNHSM